MRRDRWIGLAMPLLGTATAVAAELYVNAGATGPELGTPESPFRTIQAAIDAATAGDEIRVAAGSYAGNVRIEGKDLALRGGYGAGWARDVARNTTTLAGAGGDAVVTLIETDATIDGFRITGGTGSTDQLPYAYHGGGIYCRDGSPTIVNNVIEGNDVRSSDPPADANMGGGIYVTNAPDMTITGNAIRGNYAGRGAGIAAIGQAALIQNNTIEANVAVGDHGGGMFLAVVDALVTRNEIRGNEVGRELGYGWGGGLIVVNAGNSAELSYNVLSENFAAAYGAAEFIDEGATADIHHELIFGNVSREGCEAVSAIAVDGGQDGGSLATIAHCTVVGNRCANATRGNGLQVEGGSLVTVNNCIFWDNDGDDFATDGTSTLTITYTASQEPIPGTGNITADPRFVDAAADDYRLAPGSPCIDAGDPATPFAAEPAPNGGRADMGRYGNAADAESDNGDDDGNDDDGDGNDGGGGDGDDGDGGDDGDNDSNGGDNAGGGGDNNDGGGSSDGDNGADVGGSGPGPAPGLLCPSTAMLLLGCCLVAPRCARFPADRKPARRAPTAFGDRRSVS